MIRTYFYCNCCAKTTIFKWATKIIRYGYLDFFIN